MNSKNYFMFSFVLILIFSFLDIKINAQTVLIKPDSLYLGKIPFNSTSVRKVEIKNTSSSSLNISSIQILNDTGSNFTILNNPGSTSLAQLQNLVLDVKFTPSTNDTSRASISVVSNASTSPDIINLFAVGSSSSPISFERLFGDEEADYLASIEETLDGGYICAGNTLPPSDDYTNFLVAKTDKYGLLEWSKDYGDDETEEAKTIVQADNGNYVVFGRTDSYGNGGFDYYLIEINPAGELVWDKTYGGNKDEQASSMVKTPDGGYLLVGNTRSFGDALSTDVYIIKVSADGSIVWEKTYGGSGGESPSKVIRTNDGNYVIVGNTASFGAGSFDAYFLKIDGSGNVIWEKTFGGALEDEGSDVAEFDDGSLAVVGFTVSYGAGAKDIFLLKLDSDGNQVWYKTYGGSFQDFGSNVVVNGSDIIFTGFIAESVDKKRSKIIRTDYNGNTLQEFSSRKGSLSMNFGDLMINSTGNLVLAETHIF